jgi:hypothetical protein
MSVKADTVSMLTVLKVCLDRWRLREVMFYPNQVRIPKELPEKHHNSLEMQPPRQRSMIG